jgi:hypothetical protein
MARLPGFTAETALFVTRGANRRVAFEDQREPPGQVLPQLTFSLGCTRKGICTRECCSMNIELVGPDKHPQVTTSCWTQHNPDCSLGDLIRAIF